MGELLEDERAGPRRRADKDPPERADKAGTPSQAPPQKLALLFLAAQPEGRAREPAGRSRDGGDVFLLRPRRHRFGSHRRPGNFDASERAGADSGPALAPGTRPGAQGIGADFLCGVLRSLDLQTRPAATASPERDSRPSFAGLFRD